MIGLAVGIVSGGLQFWLLSKFTQQVTKGTLTIQSILLGIAQFFLPLCVLLIIAFFRQQDLLFTGIGMSAALIISAVTNFVVKKRRTGGRGGTDV